MFNPTFEVPRENSIFTGRKSFELDSWGHTVRGTVMMSSHSVSDEKIIVSRHDSNFSGPKNWGDSL